MRVFHRVLFAALAAVFVTAIAGLALTSQPQAVSQLLPVAVPTCGGYGPPCPTTPGTRPPATPPGTVTPAPSVPPTTSPGTTPPCVPGQPCTTPPAHCAPDNGNCLPVTGSPMAVLYAFGGGLITIGLVAIVFAYRRQTRL